MPLSRRLFAESVGTFWLVLGGCGSAVLASSQIGLLGVSFAFGLTVLTMAFAFGEISGCHLNPAVTIGLCAGGRFKKEDVAPYILAQLLGGIGGAGFLYLIATGKSGFELSNGLASNGFGEHSPDGFSMGAGFLCETVLTFMFLLVILYSTDERAPKGFAPIAIGLALTLIHLVSIPVTNTSVNPARSTGPAVLVGGWALRQLWLFWLAPIAGAVAAGAVYRALARSVTKERTLPARVRWLAPALVGLVGAGVLIFAVRPEPPAPAVQAPDVSRLTRDLDETVDSLTRTLHGITNEATAKAALPELERLRGKGNKLRSEAARLPDEERARLDERILPRLGALKDEARRVNAMPGAPGQVKTALHDLMVRLSPLESDAQPEVK